MVDLDQGGTGRDWTSFAPAPDDLAGVVEYTWIERLPAGLRRSVGRWRIVPDVSGHVIVHATDPDGAIRASAIGARSVHTDTSVRLRQWTVGLRLVPGILAVLADASGRDLLDASVPLRDAFGNDGAILLDRLREARGPEDAQAKLLSFVRRRAATRNPARLRSTGLLSAALTSGALPVHLREVSARTGLAERTLRAHCGDAFGFGPTRAIRLVRLLRAVRLGIGAGRGEGSRIAVRSGYFDQSHLHREYRLLLGESPRAFHARASRASMPICTSIRIGS